MEDNKILFEEAPVTKALARLAVPTIISQLIVMVYNLADTFMSRGKRKYPWICL